VSAVATSRQTEADARSFTFADRFLAAVPLASVYVWLCGLYAFEAWQRATPWLFTDELELTTISRAIASTGHPARLEQPHSFESLYTVMLAPVWLIKRVATAYAAAKYVDVFVMAAVVFPVYGMARMIVGKRAALFAAAGAGAIPALAYTSYLVEENLAYPYAALCFFLILKAFVVRGTRRRRLWGAAAILASLVAPAVKGELLMIPLTLVFALLFALWSSTWGKERRARWSTGDWIGFVVAAFGAIFFISGVGSHHSIQWLTVTRLYKHRIIVLGDWAAGSLAIGIGVVPLIAGLTALVRAPGETRSHEVRMFRCLALGGIFSFAMYAGMKAAYLSTDFATRVEERNLIYIAPLLFVGTALLFERRRANVLALLAAGAYAVYLMVGTPYFMDRQLYSDALGLAILEQANRYISWTPSIAQAVMLGIALGGTALLLAVVMLRRRARLAVVLAAALAVGVLGWSLTGEIAAAAGTNSLADGAAATLRHPFDWVDTRTHGARTLYLGEAIADPTAPYLLTFWNRSIVKVSSLDGSLTDPLASGSPNFLPNGALYASYYNYAVEDWPCVDFAGTKYWQHSYRAGGGFRHWRLVQLTSPNVLRSMCVGIYADGWSGPYDTDYYRFRGPAGWLRVVYSRQNWQYKSGASPVHFFLGKLVVNANRQPTLGAVTKTVNGTIDSGQVKTAWLRVPAGGFAVRVVVAKKFEPDQYNHAGDRRELGAQITYTFFRNRASATPRR